MWLAVTEWLTIFHSTLFIYSTVRRALASVPMTALDEMLGDREKMYAFWKSTMLCVESLSFENHYLYDSTACAGTNVGGATGHAARATFSI